MGNNVENNKRFLWYNYLSINFYNLPVSEAAVAVSVLDIDEWSELAANLQI